MTANRSLDEFADAGEEEASDDEGDADDAGAAEARADAAETVEDTASAADGTAPDDTEPEPPASTCVWHPDGGPCDACGETAEERWRDGDDLVCADCKAW